MPAPIPLPDALAGRPFSRDEATAAGLPSHVIRPPRFRRLHPRVWVPSGHEMTGCDVVRAAMLAVGPDVAVSHESRLRLLGVQAGPPGPVRFLVDTDLHLDLDGVMVHRTKAMPPLDGVGVAPYAAYVCAGHTRRLLDLVVLGDFLLHRGHATAEQIASMALEDRWRPGAGRILRVVPWLDARARSPKESELRVILVAAGLPVPEVNVDLVVGGRWMGCVDLLFRDFLLVVEYEGRQHASDDEQFNSDISRYGRFRRNRVQYVQITNAMLRQPRAVVRHVYDELVAQGYAGPAPEFGARWRSLFAPPPSVVPHRSAARALGGVL
ncbi:hypothetical protein [Mumia flava]|nr:hypothetical protein [Mumia flava]